MRNRPIFSLPAIENSFETILHFAHRERKDNRHSPQDVLRGALARTLPAPILARIFFATEFTRHLDRSGYIRFHR